MSQDCQDSQTINIICWQTSLWGDAEKGINGAAFVPLFPGHTSKEKSQPTKSEFVMESFEILSGKAGFASGSIVSMHNINHYCYEFQREN